MKRQCETKQLWRRTAVGAAIVALALGASAASATMITFTADGTGSDGALMASADFTTSDGQIIVTLTNLLDADVIRSAGQALSDISFTLSDGTYGTAFGTTSATGQFGDVSTNKANQGQVTYTSSDTQTGDLTPIRWFSNGGISGSTITLEAIGGGQPSQMIAPFIADGGTYTNANKGFGNFNSYIIGPATFTIALSGVTDATTVTSATFSFGTGPDTFVPGEGGPPIPGLPEPGALALIAVGLVGFAALRRKQW